MNPSHFPSSKPSWHLLAQSLSRARRLSTPARSRLFPTTRAFTYADVENGDSPPETTSKDTADIPITRVRSGKQPIRVIKNRATPYSRLNRDNDNDTTNHDIDYRYLRRLQQKSTSSVPEFSVHGRGYITLAIETSCDDTCVAIVERRGAMAHVIYDERITCNNLANRGVEPVTAYKSHQAALAGLVAKALDQMPPATTGRTHGGPSHGSGVAEGRRIPDFISVTRGPGGLANLSVGLTFAKGLSVAWGVPLVGVHHMQAHALTPRLESARSLQDYLVDLQNKMRDVQSRMDALQADRPSQDPAASNLAVGSESLSSGQPRDVVAGSARKPTKDVVRDIVAREEPQEDHPTGEGNTIRRALWLDAHDLLKRYTTAMEDARLEPAFPFLSLLVSGGHTMLLHSKGLTDHEIMVDTNNVAIGDVIDKCARDILPQEFILESVRRQAMSGAIEGDTGRTPATDQKDTMVEDIQEDGAAAESKDTPMDGVVVYGHLLERFAFPILDKIDFVFDETTQNYRYDPLPKDQRDAAIRHKSSSPARYEAQIAKFQANKPNAQIPPMPSKKVRDAMVRGYEPPLKRGDEIEKYTSTKYGWQLTPPLNGSRDMAYDFSGLGGTVRRIVKERPDMDVDERRELALQVQRLAFEHLGSRVIMALDQLRLKAVEQKRKDQKNNSTRQSEGSGMSAESTMVSNDPFPQSSDSSKADHHSTSSSSNNTKSTIFQHDIHAHNLPTTLVIAGGVAANKFLRKVIRAMLNVRGYAAIKVVCPPQDLCTDNAVMIGWAGLEMYNSEQGQYTTALDAEPLRDWSLDGGSQAAAAVVQDGGGVGGGGDSDDKKEKEAATMASGLNSSIYPLTLTQWSAGVSFETGESTQQSPTMTENGGILGVDGWRLDRR